MPIPNPLSMEAPQKVKNEAKTAENEAEQRLRAIREGAVTNPPMPTISVPPPPPASPPSSSSPSPEFSFTTPSVAATGRDKTPADLAPADDVFFNGHLLPLHLLSHPTTTISPRVSNDSVGNSRLPSRAPKTRTPTTIAGAGAGEGKEINRTTKTFTSLFGGIGRWRKEEEEDKATTKKKSRFDVLRFLRKYASVVLFFKGGGAGKVKREKRPYSFSGRSSSKMKGREEWRRKRGGELSAPASMRTSPVNSGHLTACTNFSSSDESTMEELQSAIQAAIQHCKNSIAIKQVETCPS